jgi:hypothetical protein
MDAKLERLFRRNEKVFLEIMKSKISEKNKIEMYDLYGDFITGFWVHLEEKYPYLKNKLAKDDDAKCIRWAKPP